MSVGQLSWQACWLRAGVAAAAGLGVVACSASPSPVGTAFTAAPTTAPSTPSRAGQGQVPAPLTGLASASAASAAQPAIALVVSGPNPQGLTSADVVYEEAAGPVRYIAVFQSRQASSVGPITSTQPTDGQVLDVLHPIIGYNGSATPYFLTALDKTRVTDVGYTTHPSLYSSTPQGLLASTRAMSRAVRRGAAPPPIFQYRGAGSAATALATNGVSRPSSVHITIPGQGRQVWAFDPHANRWSQTSGGPRVQAANVVIQTVPYKQLGVSRRHGIVVNTARVLGTGKAVVLSGGAVGSADGTAAPATWSKPKIADVTNYFDANGYPLGFQPGPTWVILAPPGTRVTMSGGTDGSRLAAR